MSERRDMREIGCFIVGFAWGFVFGVLAMLSCNNANAQPLCPDGTLEATTNTQCVVEWTEFWDAVEANPDWRPFLFENADEATTGLLTMRRPLWTDVGLFEAQWEALNAGSEPVNFERHVLAKIEVVLWSDGSVVARAIPVSGEAGAGPTPKPSPTAEPSPTPEATETPAPGPEPKLGVGVIVRPTVGLYIRACPGTDCDAVRDAAGRPVKTDPWTVGTIIDGPVWADGAWWWRVDWPKKGAQGWSAETWMEREGEIGLDAAAMPWTALVWMPEVQDE